MSVKVLALLAIGALLVWSGAHGAGVLPTIRDHLAGGA